MKEREPVGNTASGFAVGFVIGAIIGAAIGLLYAPKTGKETRALVKEKAGAVIKKAKETAARTKENMAKQLGEAKKKSEPA